MAKHINQFPKQFVLIPSRTMQLGEWEVEMPTEKNARSFQSTWYSYVGTLRREKVVELLLAAEQIQVSVRGKMVVFCDRRQSATQKMLDRVFPDLVDPEQAMVDALYEARRKMQAAERDQTEGTFEGSRSESPTGSSGTRES